MSCILGCALTPDSVWELWALGESSVFMFSLCFAHWGRTPNTLAEVIFCLWCWLLTNFLSHKDIWYSSHRPQLPRWERLLFWSDESWWAPGQPQDGSQLPVGPVGPVCVITVGTCSFGPQPWVLKRLSQMLACNDLTSHVYMMKLHTSPENWVWKPLDGWTYSLPKEGIRALCPFLHRSSVSFHMPQFMCFPHCVPWEEMSEHK